MYYVILGPSALLLIYMAWKLWQIRGRDRILARFREIRREAIDALAKRLEEVKTHGEPVEAKRKEVEHLRRIVNWMDTFIQNYDTYAGRVFNLWNIKKSRKEVVSGLKSLEGFENPKQSYLMDLYAQSFIAIFIAIVSNTRLSLIVLGLTAVWVFLTSRAEKFKDAAHRIVCFFRDSNRQGDVFRDSNRQGDVSAAHL